MEPVRPFIAPLAEVAEEEEDVDPFEVEGADDDRVPEVVPVAPDDVEADDDEEQSEDAE